MVWACIENRRRICGQGSDGDRGRPKQRLVDNIKNDLSARELSG